MIRQRPFRAPHYTISNAGLVGGGHCPRPGEISLSHRGVLFLDELPEFGHSLLEVLRQPLEDKVVTISRAQGRVTFPANFMLVGAMNPAPAATTATRSSSAPAPGPGLPLPEAHQRALSSTGWTSSSRCRISTTRSWPTTASARLQRRCRRGSPPPAAASRSASRGTKLTCNAEMTPAEVREFCQVDDSAQSLLKAAMKQLYLSARAFHRILKLARTIADLEASDDH